MADPAAELLQPTRDPVGSAALELVDSQSTPKGVSIQVYRPTGRPQYATATADMKHVT